MGKSKAPELDLPKVPTYYEDPYYLRGMERLEGVGNKLLRLDLTGDLEKLAPTIELDPNVTRGFFESLQPYYNDLRKRTTAELAANNQLESSVTANRLGQIDTDVSNLLQGRVADQLTQAMQNRIALFGTGLNTVSGVTSYAQANQGQRNAFNLDTYQALVDQALARYAAQPGQRGGLAGGLAGAAGGAATGAAIGSIIPGIGTGIGAVVGGIAGGLYGGLSRTPGAGESLMATGASSFSRFAQTPTGQLPYAPGSSATNQPFGDVRLRGLLDRDPRYALYGGLN